MEFLLVKKINLKKKERNLGKKPSKTYGTKQPMKIYLSFEGVVVFENAD